MTVLAILALAYLTLDALRLRSWVDGIHALHVVDRPLHPGHIAVVRDGVTLDEATAQAASAYLQSQSLSVVDLWPSRMPSLDYLAALSGYDPKALEDDVMAPGRTAGFALVVDRDVLERAGGRPDPCGPNELALLAAELKRCAPRRYAAARSLPSAPPPPPLRRQDHTAVLRTILGVNYPPWRVARTLFLFALAALAAASPWGIAALAIYHVQPAVVLLGQLNLRPTGILPSVLLRWPFEVARIASTWLSRSPRPMDDPEVRATYQQLLAEGPRALVDGPRTTCPLCGGGSLKNILRAREMFQRKPGIHTLTRCRGCAFVFQNPQLSERGLEYYYKDFYDGRGADTMLALLAMNRNEHCARIAEIAPHAPTDDPRFDRWLDVGGGHGHFCLLVKDARPTAGCDLMDQGAGVQDAVRRGWVDRGMQGSFPSLAPQLEGEYGVVTMSHYLEHTRDPRAELAAAATVLKPGGLLMVEVPNPESPLGRLLGGAWMPWFIPQHLNMPTMENLRQLVVAEGFDIVLRQTGQAHQPRDLTGAVVIVAHRLTRPADAPWLEPERWWHPLVRMVVSVGAFPLVVIARLGDAIIQALATPLGIHNTFRILARKPDPARTNPPRS